MAHLSLTWLRLCLLATSRPVHLAGPHVSQPCGGTSTVTSWLEAVLDVCFE
eukprot:CAMPEP_0119381392 /NCGR_PEP_ID=MMETSP1334-20130426/63897_1 /TAXON_ID=127549 /ORGANISM="Calcidiscus leptoporus, Strain RCC1130" /LENGTH=50 /DNA_ID=CAMNT_0007401505 /DNA_START=53 /DNA_END=205 /DNA_ORIENTATION=+